MAGLPWQMVVCCPDSRRFVTSQPPARTTVGFVYFRRSVHVASYLDQIWRLRVLTAYLCNWSAQRPEFQRGGPFTPENAESKPLATTNNTGMEDLAVSLGQLQRRPRYA